MYIFQTLCVRKNSREQNNTMSIKTKKKALFIYTVLSLIAGLAFTVYRTALLKQNYDPYSASFEHGAAGVFRTYEYALIAVALVLSTSIFFIKKIKLQLFSARYSTTSVSICAICGFIFAATAILLTVNYSDIIFNLYSNSLAHSVLYIIALVAMLLSALYFIGCASTRMQKSCAKPYLSLFPTIFCALYMGASYFDTDYLFYDFNHITSQIAFMAMMLFMLAEANLATDQNAYRLYFAMSLVCIVCVSAHVIPLLLLVSFWEIKATIPITTELASIGILIYAILSAFNAVRTLENADGQDSTLQ